MKNALISIITINYNNAEGLRKTIESVKNLKNTSFEYLVIDGGSSDSSPQIIEENKSFIDVAVSEKDEGLYNAINKGIKLASGKIIGLIHSGDTILPNALDNLPALHQQNPDSVLYGALKAVKNGRFDSVWGFNADLLPRQMIPHLAAFVPKSVYSQYGLYNEKYKIAADYECFLRFYKAGVSFVFYDAIVCEFNLEGVSQNKEAETAKEVEEIKKTYGVYQAPGKKQRIKTFIKRFL